MSPRITATRGPLLGQSFPLQGELTLGRDATNSIAIADQQISRRHCRFAGGGDQFLVEDLGSSNGTYVNDRKIVGAFDIHPGDRIRIGGSEFVLEVADAQRPRETSRNQEGAARPAAPGSILPPVRPINDSWQLPDFSFLSGMLSGCLAGLMKLLPFLAAAMLILCLLGSLARLGLGVISCGAAKMADRQDQSQPSSQTSGGQQGGGGSEASSSEENDSGIEILEAKVMQTTRMPLPHQINVLVVKWKNRTGHPVRHIRANVQCYDANGGISIMKPFVDIYLGEPVANSATHQDTESTGALLDLTGDGASPPRSAKLEISLVE